MSDDDWKAGLPEALHDAPFFAKASSLDDAIAGVKHAAQLRGKSILAPDADADEASMSEFKDRLTTKYPGIFEQPQPEPFAPGEDAPKELVEHGRLMGYTQEQFDNALEHHANQQAQLTEYRQEQHNELKSLWDLDHQDNMTGVARYLAASGAPESLQQALEAGTLDATSVAWLHQQAQLQDTEGAEFHSQRGQRGGGGRVTNDQAIQQLDNKMLSGKLNPEEYQSALNQKVRLLGGES